MTDLQQQVVIGAVLGGSSITKQPRGKNYYLSMRSKDSVWLQYKIAELHNYFYSASLAQQNNTYRCNSICSTEFTKLYEMLYRKNLRYVSEDILNKVQDMALAIWFIEGGGWAGRNRKNAYLNTTLLGKEGTETVQKYLNDICDIPCNVNKNKQRRKVLFTVKGTAKLIAVIGHRFPPFYVERIKRAPIAEGSGVSAKIT